MNDLRRQLNQILSGRTCLVGLGNTEQGDDGLGIRLAQQVSESAAAPLSVLLAGTHPECHLTRLSQHDLDHVIFLDAVEFGAEPGAVVLLDSTEMRSRYPQISTHRISLGLLAQCLESGRRTRAWLLGVQPESFKPCTGLSARVKATLDLLGQWLADAVHHSSTEKPMT